jgi:ADP-ribose pyrophosphatase YjhB (NUDIX family)
MAKERRQTEVDFGIRVGAVVERGGNILLVRHQKPDREPYWVLPGGRLEPGETIPECAERELAEETQLTARFSEVLYVSEFMRDGRHTVDVTVSAVADKDDEPTLGSDPEVEEGAEQTLTELRWVGLDDMGDIELLPSWVQERIVRDAERGRSGTETDNGVYLGGGRD